MEHVQPKEMRVVDRRRFDQPQLFENSQYIRKYIFHAGEYIHIAAFKGLLLDIGVR